MLSLNLHIVDVLSYGSQLTIARALEVVWGGFIPYVYVVIILNISLMSVNFSILR